MFRKPLLLLVLPLGLICNELFAQEKDTKFSNLDLLYMMNSLALDPNMQANVGLTDKQTESLKRICAEATKKHRDMRRKVASDFQKRKEEENLQGEEYKKEYKKVSEQFKVVEEEFSAVALKEIEDILIPAQAKNLRQYAFRVRQRAYYRPFRLLKVGYETIGMSEAELKKAKKELEDIKAKYAKEVEKLRKQVMDDVNSSLSKENSKKLEDLIGRNIFPAIE